MNIIIKHFYNYPLLTSKRFDFYLFSLLYEMICNEAHFTQKGFFHCLAIINNINKPIDSNKLLYFINFYGKLPDLIFPPVRQFNSSLLISNPWWIVGFICAEGSFSYYTKKYKGKALTAKLHHTLVLEIYQDSKDIYILKAIANYCLPACLPACLTAEQRRAPHSGGLRTAEQACLTAEQGSAGLRILGVGNIFSEKRGISKFKISILEMIQHILIPFLNIYPLLGFKRQQYEIWIKAVEIKLTLPKYSLNRETKLYSVLTNLTALRKKNLISFGLVRVNL
uniref:GIY-YIG endonuclease n=1 Tax=Ramaria rubella TaxID=113071 RepID=UPI0022384EFA|nr:GIY-YIG endonuclease [Ramaria rubella]UYR22249.1 GIY-YIG endonuclease [Ramaria rubella]